MQSTATTTTEEPTIEHLELRTATIEPVQVHTEVVEHKPIVHLEPRSPIIEPVDVQADVVEEKPIVHLEPRGPTADPVDPQADIVVEHKTTITHLEPRPATIEPVDIQIEPTPIILSSKKKDEPSTVSKSTTATALNLHGAGVELPEVELVEPGPLPTISITKEKHKKAKEPITAEKPAKAKKSTGGLCASCFGAKAAQKQKKQAAVVTANAPIEQTKLSVEEKVDSSPPLAVETPTVITASPTIDSSPLPVLSVTADQTVSSDTIKEELLEQTSMVN